MSGWNRKARRSQVARENKLNGSLASAGNVQDEMKEAYKQLLSAPVEGLPKEQFRALVVMDVLIRALKKTGSLKQLGKQEQLIIRLCGEAFHQASEEMESRIIVSR